MPTWIDENHIAGETPDDEFVTAVEERMHLRIAKEEEEGEPLNYGNDGVLSVYHEVCTYRDVRYVLGVCRYFWVRRTPNGIVVNPDNTSDAPPRWNRILKHVVVETPEGGPPSGDSQFLWHDSLHTFSEDWTLRQQWDWCREQAEQDINDYRARNDQEAITS